MPLMPNGKTDRKALQSIEGRALKLGSEYIAPETDIENEKIFRREMDNCLNILKNILERDVKGIIYPEKSLEIESKEINETQFTQPLLCSFEYALAKQLIGWGIKPNAMIGHGLGEYVAACIAEVFTLEEALSLVSARGKLMQSAKKGSMMMVEINEEELRKLINDDISIAAINGEKN